MPNNSNSHDLSRSWLLLFTQVTLFLYNLETMVVQINCIKH